MLAWLKAARQHGPTTVGWCWRAALSGLFSIANISPAAGPDIESIAPLAVHSNVPVELTLSGSDLSNATELWTSFPVRAERIGAARFRVVANAPVGLGAVRVFGSNGVSNLSFLMVDDLPTVAESKTNRTREAAQVVELGSAVEGRCEELSCDWFKLRLIKGQRVNVETVAARLGSKLDSVLRVINAAGRELVHNDDAPGQSGDSSLNFAAPATGDYFVEVRDVSYGGGSTFFYRLRCGGSPVGSEYLKTNSTQQPQITSEREPNDTPTTATQVSLTNSIHGRFNKAGDRDLYEFTARKDERLEFRAATRSLGSACDAMLQLESADGKRLARSNPSAADEGVLTYRFESDGAYRLVVEEAIGAFGSNLVYEISARPAAGFALTLDTDRVNVAPGKNFELKVNITRTDHKGAVALQLDGLPETFSLTNNVIAEGKSNVTMRVTVPGTVLPGTWQTFSILGTARREGREVQARASTGPALRKVLPLRLHPPPELDGEVALGIVAP